MAETCAPGTQSPARIAILYALPDEIRYFSRHAALSLVDTAAGFRIETVSPRALPSADPYSLCIGIGAERAYRNSALLLASAIPVRALVVIGFAGALTEQLKPGAVVVGETALDVVTGNTYLADSGMLAAMDGRTNGELVGRGSVATVARVLGRSTEKQQFARNSGALAVDMESAGVAAAATEHGVPWIAVRVISDGLNDDLPLDFNALANPDGSVNIGRIIAAVLLRPWKIPSLLRLGARSSVAARNLAAFLEPRLTSL